VKAVVLCGGKGTRLRPYTHTVPKPMLVLGRKPILQYIVEYLRKQGVSEIIMTVGHLKEQIIDYFGDGSKFGIKIQYSAEENSIGTAGSVKKAAKLLKGEENFLVLMGDQLTNIDLKKFMDSHLKRKAVISVALKRSGMPFQYGTAEIDKDSNITAFAEKPIIQNLVNVAIYALNKRAIDFLPEEGDFALDVFPAILKSREKLAGYVFDDYWIDVGSLQDYEHMNKLVSIIDLIANHDK